jgi:hypothetical protein
LSKCFFGCHRPAVSSGHQAPRFHWR